MLPTRWSAPPSGDGWIYEPAYGGLRAIVDVTPGTGPGHVTIRTPPGRDVTRQHRGIVSAFATLARRLKAPVRLDGAIIGDAFVAFSASIGG